MTALAPSLQAFFTTRLGNERDVSSEVVATRLVRFDVLELTERYEDRVDLVVGILAKMRELESRASRSNRTSPPQLTYDLKPKRGEGAASANPPIDTAEEVWRRIDIRPGRDDDTDNPIKQLEFTSIGRLARAERMLESVERAIIDPLLADAINDHANPNISGTLYELLIPHELKGELGSSEHLHLLVDERTADLPWELLRPRSDEDERSPPVALRVSLLRQFRETERVRYDVRRAAGNNVLVIGNPPVPGASSLPGATRECTTSARLFEESNWTVKTLIWDTKGRATGPGPDRPDHVSAVEALHWLLNGDWRVVHVAAHGEFTGDPETTGVLLGGLRLTAQTFSKMSVVPDLVILNSCHLGRFGSARSLAGANRTAASIGRALLQIGVRAAVVAGWAVHDVAAEAFAGRLLHGLLDGEDFGSAVFAARQAAKDATPESLTWGAYQCYGDPGFSLAPRTRAWSNGQIHTVGELRRRIRQLAAVASDQGRSARTSPVTIDDAIRRRLEEFERLAEQLGGRALFADLAEVWGDLLDFDASIRLYEAALARGGSDVPVRAIEQLGNMLSRRARRRYYERGQSASVQRDVRAAETWMYGALEFGESAERHALLGGFHKRAAAMNIGGAPAEHLSKAIRQYALAQRIEGSEYHALNWLQLVEIARLNNVLVDADQTIEGRVVREGGRLRLVDPAPTTDEPRSAAASAADFWQRAAAGDRLLTAILVDGSRAGDDCDESMKHSTLQQDIDALVASYEAAFRLRSNARERASVVEHLRDLVDLTPAGEPIAAGLEDARRRLELWPGRVESQA